MEDSVQIMPIAPTPNYPTSKGEKLYAPVNFRSRVIATFRAERNVDYMRKLLLAHHCDAGYLRDVRQKMYEFSDGSGRAYDILNSDPLARRGNARQASDMWSELRRLNREFYDNAMSTEVSMNDEDNEPYHMREFISDSLRPPGLEHLNDPDRPMFGSKSAAAGVEPEPHYAEEDWAWSPGNANRSAEQALAEYWGEEMMPTDARIKSPCGPSQAQQALRGEWWFTSDSGPRRQRYEGIPFWQRAGARNFDKDIGETLSMATRETGNQVRGWDMERLRNPRGQETRRYGPRSGDRL